MFTSIKLINFKSFGEIYFDFKKNKKETKKFISLYGENGSGKSNFVTGFELLLHVLDSFSDYEMARQIRDDIDFNPKDKTKNFTKNFTLEYINNMILLNNMSEFLKSCRMIDCDEETTVEYGFMLNGIEGYYKISFKETITFEELYYTVGSQRGKVFTIALVDNKIHKYFSGSTFKNDAYKKEFEHEIDKYWGKHALLGILNSQIEAKNKQYIDESISKDFLDVFELFKKTKVFSNSYTGYINSNLLYTIPFSNGNIPIEIESKLDLYENILRDFFNQLYSDIQDVYYEKKKTKKTIDYQLHIKKMIAGQIRDISIDNESSGTKSVLEIFQSLISAISGDVVIYDEIDDGIHDLLIKNIVSSLEKYITGQLIITTHNTLMLETIDHNSAYVIYVDSEGNKEARCLADFRIKKTNNVRNLYLNGVFGGIPYSSEIDYSNIKTCINDIKEDND